MSNYTQRQSARLSLMRQEINRKTTGFVFCAVVVLIALVVLNAITWTAALIAAVCAAPLIVLVSRVYLRLRVKRFNRQISGNRQ